MAVNIPNTENLHVAIVAAALHLSEFAVGKLPGEDLFERRLERFLVAYTAIDEVTHTDQDKFDIKSVMDRVKTELRSAFES